MPCRMQDAIIAGRIRCMRSLRRKRARPGIRRRGPTGCSWSHEGCAALPFLDGAGRAITVPVDLPGGTQRVLRLDQAQFPTVPGQGLSSARTKPRSETFAQSPARHHRPLGVVVMPNRGDIRTKSLPMLSPHPNLRTDERGASCASLQAAAGFVRPLAATMRGKRRVFGSPRRAPARPRRVGRDESPMQRTRMAPGLALPWR
jgi:hypothetical protein